MSIHESNAPAAKNPSPWREGFRAACLLSLVFAISLMLISRTIPRGNTEQASPLFLMADGLLALAELLSWLAVGLCGIAWMLSPRR
jgi:uncharacterized membrane protein YciS (DUF1049 family)